jgi:hypothetical protein
MGSPVYPTISQVEKLNATTALRPPVSQSVQGDHLDVTLEPNALMLIEIPNS